MDDSNVIEMGSFFEVLFDQPQWQEAVHLFEAQCFQHWVLSQPKDKMEREGTYAQYQGAKDFLEHLRAFVHQRDDLLKRAQELSTDAPFEDID